MPVFNGQLAIRAAIESVLAQTFSALELIVVNDGSTDTTAQILDEAAAADPRIRVLTHSENLGLVASLNNGIAHASTELIARLDADDLAYPTRLAQQVALFDEQPDVVLCATGYERVNAAGEVLAQARPPLSHAALAGALLSGNCICHSSVMFQRSAVLAVGGYRREWFPVEDYDLWLRLIGIGRYVGLAEILVGYLVNPDGVSALNARQEALARERMLQYLSTWSDITVGAGVANTLNGGLATVGDQRVAIRVLQHAAHGLDGDLRRRGIDSNGVYAAPMGVGLQVLRHRGRIVRQLTLLTTAPRLAIRGRKDRSMLA